ncbi:MAG: peptidoglycan binding domain-containing protein [Nocardioidaceae bacterium]
MRWSRRRVYVDDLPKTHDARFLVIFLLMFVVALGAVYAVGYVAAGDKVPARTTIAGVPVGSMSRHQASAELARAMSDRLTEPMRFTVAGSSVRLTPEAAGLSLDVEATLDEAMGGTDWNPAHMLKVVEGGGEVDPVFRADATALARALAPLAAQVRQDPVDSTVTIRAARPVVREGHPGRRLDVSAAADAAARALSAGQSFVALRLLPVPPTVDVAAASAFVEETLRPAVSRPVVVSLGGHPLTVTPEQFTPALRITRSDGQFRIGIVPLVLHFHTRDVLRSLPGRPVEAQVVFRDGSPTVVAGRRGIQVEQAAWADAVLAAATRSTSRHATGAVTVADPDLTTSDARALSIERQLGGASATADTRLAGALALAARNLDETIVLPGADFSFVREVGPANAATVTSPLGQATQTAAERAQMTITRWPAVSPVGHDLGFRNASDRPVYIRCWVVAAGPERAMIHVEFWGSGA